MTADKFQILYSSNGTYSIIETDAEKRYQFTYINKNLTYEEVLKCIQALKSGYKPPEQKEENPLKRMQKEKDSTPEKTEESEQIQEEKAS